MKKKILLVSLFVSTSLVLVSCSLIRVRGLGGGVPGSENIKTEIRHPGVFQVVSIEYPGAKVIIQQGAKESVEIQADDNLLPQLSTEVLSGRLTIKSKETNWKTSVNPSKQVEMAITARDLNEIVLSAEVGDLEVNDLQTGTLKLVLSGGAQIKLNGIQVDLLDSNLSGAGDIQASGIANEIKLVLSGLGNFNAADLKSNKANVELSGMGNATVWVEKELAAIITGAGSINYLGNPRVDKTLNGAGSVKPAE